MSGIEVGPDRRAGGRILFAGARRVDASGVADDSWLLIADGTIVRTGTGRPPAEAARDATILDVRGAMITPGLIDLHAHGAGGYSFDDGVDAILAARAVHRGRGTTRSVISLVTATTADLLTSIEAIAEARLQDPGVLGAHLEGPFIAAGRRGAHDPALIADPSPAAIAPLLDRADVIRQITLAPELPGALDAVEAFAARGVRVAVGHTEADYARTREAFARGATLLTHAFNAMSPIHHRQPGPIVAAVEDVRVTLEVILDGIHVHPAVARMLADSAPGRVALVSDAMAAAGVEDGSYRLGSLDVQVADGRATLADGTIAGSTLTLDSALRIAMRAGFDEVAAISAVTSVPAAALGESERLGRLAPGYAADVIWWAPGCLVHRVWVDGVEIDAVA